MPIYRLENVVQPYAWGSTTAIADLLGQPSPAPEPQAELWMGTHSQGPSMVIADGGRIPLQQLIEQQPHDILGPDIVLRFGKALPYLFKVLAAARPLSIQAHPSKDQAEAGFSREDREGKPLDAPDRSYRDDNHKPEIICALTPFWGLNGFGRPSDAAELLAPVCPKALEDGFQRLTSPQGQGLREFFTAMLTLSADQRQTAARQVVKKATPRAEASPVYRWMVDLALAYPADMGILSPALLNLICLAPGQAMYLPAGQLHAYLDGVGIELMANSDNVLRGGLTPKHVDVPELLKCGPVCGDKRQDSRSCTCQAGGIRLRLPGSGIFIWCHSDLDHQPYVSPSIRSVEMLLCTAGQGRLDHDGHAEKPFS
jgi:mannose-6-phosphate isomerase